MTNLLLLSFLYYERHHSFSPSSVSNIAAANRENIVFGGIAIPRFSSPKRTSVSPGLILKSSLACFSITICPVSPTVVVYGYFPSIFFVNEFL